MTTTTTSTTTTSTTTRTDAVAGGPADTARRCDPHTRDPEQLPRWQHGRVAWFNTEKGFGFLTPDTGPAVFVDHQVIDGPGYRTLVAGQPVVFTAADTGRGPEATRVVPYTRAYTTARFAPRRSPHNVGEPGRRCRYRNTP